jgi:hypothetical protein
MPERRPNPSTSILKSGRPHWNERGASGIVVGASNSVSRIAMAENAKARPRAVLAVLAGGALLILAGALIAIVFLVRQNCGSDLSYFGCAVPTASIPNEMLRDDKRPVSRDPL